MYIVNQTQTGLGALRMLLSFWLWPRSQISINHNKWHKKIQQSTGENKHDLSFFQVTFFIVTVCVCIMDNNTSAFKDRPSLKAHRHPDLYDLYIETILKMKNFWRDAGALNR